MEGESSKRPRAASKDSIVLQSMFAPVSPPRKKRRDGETDQAEDSAVEVARPNEPDNNAAKLAAKNHLDLERPAPRRFIKSPFQLSAIQDLPPEANVDAMTLEDIVGDPLIAEIWEFNYLHDIDFLLAALDPDVRHLVQVHVIHGFWKREDARRENLLAQASRHSNVHLHTAFMPEPFGTHHSKMAILLRHDDTAQVAIYTANMIHHDWANMTQGVWRSPLLPMLKEGQQEEEDNKAGSGYLFKNDLLNYLGAYNARAPICQPLVDKLSNYDFSSVRGTLVASVPGRHRVKRFIEGRERPPTQWGWAGLKNALQSIPVQPTGPASEIVLQVSSIATLGPTDAWLKGTLLNALAAGKVKEKEQNQNTQQLQLQAPSRQPEFRVLFPTADEIRRSLDGYMSGTSIHMKIESPQQQKQLQYMRPLLCHWANDAEKGAKLPKGSVVAKAGRKRAAPHIKTYVRYGKEGIDWALQTSANISKQAWGEAVSKTGEARIASWEIGVLVWPELFAEQATMQPTFGSDSLQPGSDAHEGGHEKDKTKGTSKDGTKDDTRPVVALRIPYDLPLQRYGNAEIPWVATMSHAEPDWKGLKWDI